MSQSLCSYNKWRLQHLDNPFELYKLDNVFHNAFISKLRKDLLNLVFEHNVNDLFSLRQTQDIYKIKNTLNKSKLVGFLKFLNDFREFLMKYFSISLKDDISVSGSMYNKGDYLLCHDDKLDDRAIAFILYLNEDWKNEWGGSLDILNKDDNGYPSDVVYRIFPECNRLLFFKVGDYTYHQVSEVLSDVSRLTINGWFHSSDDPIYRTLPLQEDYVSFSEPISLPAGLTLEHIINDTGTLMKFPSKISKSKFLKRDVYNMVKRELTSNDVTWKKLGPPNQRKYYFTDDVTNLATTKMLHDIFSSHEMVCFLQTFIRDDDTDTVDLETENVRKTVHIEFQKWTPSCYLLANAANPNKSDNSYKSIDVFVFFDVTKRNESNSADKNDDDDDDDSNNNNDEECSGNIYYINSFSQASVQEICPKSNYMYIVDRNADRRWFTSYVSKSLYSCAYYVMYASYVII